MKRISLLLSLSVASAAAQPQGVDEPVAVQSTVTRVAESVEHTPGVQRIVDLVSSGELSDYQMPDLKTVTFTVPVDEIEQYRYFVATIGPNGAGSSSARPDENGIIHEQVVAGQPAGDGNSPREADHYYLYAVDKATGEHYYTLDLPQLRLKQVVLSLAMAKRAPRQPGTRPPPRTGPPFQFDNDSAQDLLVSLRGERLSLDDVLDQIYRQTGCAVFEDGDTLRVEECY